MSVGQLLVILTAVAAGAAILWPLRGARTKRVAPTDVSLELARDVKLKEINELEFDYRLGKLSTEDYEELRLALRSEAVAIIRLIDAAAPADGTEQPPEVAA